MVVGADRVVRIWWGAQLTGVRSLLVEHSNCTDLLT